MMNPLLERCLSQNRKETNQFSRAILRSEFCCARPSGGAGFGAHPQPGSGRDMSQNDMEVFHLGLRTLRMGGFLFGFHFAKFEKEFPKKKTPISCAKDGGSPTVHGWLSYFISFQRSRPPLIRIPIQGTMIRARIFAVLNIDT